MSGSFKVERGAEGPVCQGPYGPMAIHNKVDGTTVDTPAGRAYLDWDMSRRDWDTLDAGVAITLGTVSGRLRRDGRALVLDGPDGRLAIVRRKPFARFAVEDARGAEVVRVKWSKLRGEARPGAAAEHVTLAVLVMVSGALMRGGGGALTPFG